MRTVVVLTGGIGTGKSTAARRFAEAGATVVAADEVGHALLAPGGAAHAAVAARWPTAVVDDTIDRRALGRIVFSDAAELEALEAITHPLIRREVERRIAEADGLVVVEVPVPAPWLDPAWPRVVVDAPDELRVDRLRRRGLDDEEIAGRRAAQPDREAWLAGADHVLDNAGGRGDLEAAVDALVVELVGPSPD